MKVDSRLFELFNGVRGEHIIPIHSVQFPLFSPHRDKSKVYTLFIELEVKLPSRALWWVMTLLISQCDSHLDDLQKIDVAPHRLVMVFRRRLERTNRPRYDAREFGIL